MNDRTFLRMENAGLRQLLEMYEADNPMAAQIKQRIEDNEFKLKDLSKETSLLPRSRDEIPRAAFFLHGGIGVEGSEGIRPSLAGLALIEYERMFTAQALHDEREATPKGRRPKGAKPPELLLTATHRGSVGFEFVPREIENDNIISIHVQAFRNIGKTLASIAFEKSNSLEELLSQTPRQMLKPLKNFFTTLARFDVDLRLAFSEGPDVAIDSLNIKQVAQRLEKDLKHDILKVDGVFKGLTLESGHFDHQDQSGSVLTGFCDEELSVDDLHRLHGFTEKPCRAIIEETTISSVTKTARSYVLKDLRPIPE